MSNLMQSLEYILILKQYNRLLGIVHNIIKNIKEFETASSGLSSTANSFSAEFL